jgi:hypothetical protein
MQTYRCFCLTVDNRIIAGAHIVAEDNPTAVKTARERWQGMPDFNSVEVWFRSRRVYPRATSVVTSSQASSGPARTPTGATKRVFEEQ